MTLYFEAVDPDLKGNIQSLESIKRVTPTLLNMYDSIAEIKEKYGDKSDDFDYPSTMKDVFNDLSKMEGYEFMTSEQNADQNAVFYEINREFLRTFGMNIGTAGVFVSYFDNTSYTKCQDPVKHATEGECLVMLRKKRIEGDHTVTYHELYVPDDSNAYKFTITGKISERILDTGIEGFGTLHILDLNVKDATDSSSEYWHNEEEI